MRGQALAAVELSPRAGQVLAPTSVAARKAVAAGAAGGFMGATRGRAMDINTWLLGHEARIVCREPR